MLAVVTDFIVRMLGVRVPISIIRGSYYSVTVIKGCREMLVTAGASRTHKRAVIVLTVVSGSRSLVFWIKGAYGLCDGVEGRTVNVIVV